MGTSSIIFRQLFDPETSTYTYLLADSLSKEAALIDTVFEKTARDLQLLKQLGLKLKYVFETHIHADHITGASVLRESTGAQVALSVEAGIHCADIQIKDGDTFFLGKSEIKAIATPGHTNTCTTYFWEDRLFTGDTLFVRDVGRTDFQQGSNPIMFESITKKIYSYPDLTAIFPGHDYNGHLQSSVAEEKQFNIKVTSSTSLREFEERMLQMKLAQPKKIHIAVPANLKCGKV